MTTKPGAPDPAFGRCQIARAGLSVRSLELNHLAHRIPPLDADCQPHTITLWVFSPRDDPSDAAAVRGDAGSDCSAPGTDGIDRRGPAQAAESVYKGLGKEERRCKSRGISGNFGGAGSDLGALGG